MKYGHFYMIYTILAGFFNLFFLSNLFLLTNTEYRNLTNYVGKINKFTLKMLKQLIFYKLILNIGIKHIMLEKINLNVFLRLLSL